MKLSNNLQSIYSQQLKKFESLSNEKFRAKQIFEAIYKKYVSNIDECSNISKAIKQEIKNQYSFNTLEIIQKEVSMDGSIKYLFALEDGHTIETVLLKMKPKRIAADGKIIKSEKLTICLSTQVGCKIGCSFCLTGKNGFLRNLSAGEIVAQIVVIKKDLRLDQNKSLNIVYMGMGEPLDNYDNFIHAVRIISDKNGLCISPKRQTVSTSGLSKRIKDLAQEDLGINLAISLHAVSDELRNELIPTNKRYNISSIISAVKEFSPNARKKILFEYLVIKNKNDDLKSAHSLVKLLNGIDAKVNLIYFNPYSGSNYERPSKESMVHFQEFLLKKGLLCTIRESKGLDISAACGQLKEKGLNGNY